MGALETTRKQACSHVFMQATPKAHVCLYFIYLELACKKQGMYSSQYFHENYMWWLISHMTEVTNEGTQS